jgi:KUP system potassium uptake protein
MVPDRRRGGVFACMATWKDGGRWRAAEFAKQRVRFEDFLVGLKVDPPPRVKGTAIFMTQDPEGTPPALLHHLKHNQVLHEHLVCSHRYRRAECRRAGSVRQLGHGIWR